MYIAPTVCAVLYNMKAVGTEYNTGGIRGPCLLVYKLDLAELSALYYTAFKSVEKFSTILL